MTDMSAIRVLVLDDDPLVLQLLSLMLGRLGCQRVETYCRGREALESVASQQGAPDLILCDLNMPEMDGVEFVRGLVDSDYRGSLIIVSGEDERVLQTAEKLVRAHRIEVLGYLAKPVSPQKLAGLLARWVPPSAERSAVGRKAVSARALRAAIDNGELVNYYQPKVSVSSGRVSGVECLVRWRQPSEGLVFPDQFIGVAEENALIDDLTRVVLSEAFAQARRWRAAGLTLTVAVNVSMDNLVSLDFPAFVTRHAASEGVDPEEIVLEITESRLMKDPRPALECLMRLRLKGFRLAIDDFGTGHSSLAQLRDIPFNELKIDRGFVHRASADRTVRAMYEASLGLARQLGMEVVAEGVEDENDWAFLRQTGCDFAQGYYIAKAMPGNEINAWVRGWEARHADLTRECLPDVPSPAEAP